MTTPANPLRRLETYFGILPKRGLISFHALRGLLLLALLFSQSQTVHANDVPWISTGGGSWSVGSNWSGGVAPGSTSSTTNSDTAIFDDNVNGGTIVIDKVGQNIGSITFGASSVSTIGTTSGNILLLSSGGSISISANLQGGYSPTVNAPLVLEPASTTSNGVYTFANDDLFNSNYALNFGGSISGGSTTGSITLNLTGVSAGTNTIGGAISNGGAASGLGVTVGQDSSWTLSGNNTYTGNTTLNGGTFTLQGSMNSLSALVANGGTFNDDSSSSTESFNGLTLNSGISIVTAVAGNTLNLGAITQNPDAMVAFNSISTTGSITTSNTGFLGPWAYYVTSSGLSYAVGGGSSSPISAYTGGTAATVGTLANMTDSTVNYTYNGSSATLTGDITGNTLNFIQGTVPTINLNGYTITLNGLIPNGATFTGAGNIIIGSSNTLDIVNNGQGSKIYSVISGAGSLVVGTASGGNSYISLLGNNAYTGGTVINAGVLDIEASGTSSLNSGLGTGTITLNNGAELVNNSNPGVAIALATNNAQVWNGSFTYLSGSPLSLGAGNITIISDSTISNLSPFPVVEAGNIGGTGDLSFNNSLNADVILNGTVNNAGELTNLGKGNVTINGNIGSNVTGVVQDNYDSVFILAGSNTYTGGTTINSGEIQVGNGGTTGYLSSGGVLDNGTLTYDRSDTITESNVIAGTGAVQQAGTGTLILANANTYTGGTTVSAGTLVVGVVNALASTGAVTVSGGTFSTSTFNSTVGTVTLTNGTITGTGTLTGSSYATQSGTISATLGGSGIALTQSTTGTTTLTVPNTYTGSTTISAGALQLGIGGTTGSISTSSVITDNGSLIIDRINSVAQGTDFSGSAITGSGAFVQAGTGTTTLNAADAYTGGTTVKDGTLLWSGSNNLPATGTLTVNAGGTFSLADGTARTTTTAALSLASGADLEFDWKNATVDDLTSTAAITTGNIGLIISPSSSVGGPLTLISSTNGGLSSATYYLADNTNFKATLAKSSTAVTISNYSTVIAPPTFYWQGNEVTGTSVAGVDNSWALSNGTTNVSNWSSTSGSYTATSVVPGSTANVVFSNTSPTPSQESTVLGASMSVKSLTINDSVAVTIAGIGDTLTLNSMGTGTTSAIVVSSSASNPTISTNLSLGANQTWDIASGKTLAVSGAVGGSYSLTKADTGTLVLSSANSTYTGGTTISGGTLDAENSSGSATGSGAVSLGAASLLSNGSGTIAGAVTATGASAASTIAVGSSGSNVTGNLTLSGGVTSTTGLTLSFAIDGAGATNSSLVLGNAGLSVTGGLTFDLNDLGANTLAPNTVYTLVSGTGPVSADAVTVNLTNSKYTLNTSYGINGGVLINGYNVTFQVQNVPEPSIETELIAGGLLLVGFYARRRTLAKLRGVKDATF